MIIIREATPIDAEYIAKISTDSLGYLCQADLVAKRLRNMDTNRHKVFVAAENNLVIGFVHAELYQLLYQEDSINVLGLAVSNHSQGKGCGRKLMQAVEAWAKEMNCSSVRLNSEVSRAGAHCFYEKIGYKNTKSQKRFSKVL